MSMGMRVISIFLPLGIIVVGLGAIVIWSREPNRFPLRTVEIRATLKHVREEEVKTMVAPLLSKGFFWLNVRSVQEVLKQMPWIHSAEVRRVWPDRLLISVQEQTAQARWGEKGVLSTEGAVFYPRITTISEKLPQFKGPESRIQEMLQQYFTLLEALGPLGLGVRTLELSPTGSWQVMLDNGMVVILGKTALSERLTRFGLAYQNSLQEKSERIVYVDLRYTNGFAIGWKMGVQ